MLDLALSKGTGPIPGKGIAERQRISQSYLDNLMGPLRVAGLVRTIRGPSGGFTLAKPPDHIKLSDIWKAMEGPVCLIDCIYQPDYCNQYEQCITRHLWQETNDAINAVLESYSLEDLKNKAKSD
jgi:Rrf2 family protein